MRTPLSYFNAPFALVDETETRLGAAVVKHVLSRARGFCECCGSPAPFRWGDGEPYLEIHCVSGTEGFDIGEGTEGHFGEIGTLDLTETGPVAALCPTCHRRVHHSLEAAALDARLREDVRAVDTALQKGDLKVVTAAVIPDGEGRVLVTQRAYGPHKGLWEFPGGKITNDHEMLEKCIARELKEELAVDVIKAKPFTMIDHDYGSFFLRMYVFVCKVEGQIDLRDHSGARWVGPREFSELDLAPADQKVASKLASLMDQETALWL